MTLSKRQQEVINLMGEGWLLIMRPRLYVGVYIFKPHKSGGKDFIHMNTFKSLKNKGLIKISKVGYESNIYKLTDKAKGL